MCLEIVCRAIIGSQKENGLLYLNFLSLKFKKIKFMDFKLKSNYEQSDQPQAISGLINSIRKGNQDQTLLGVTGSGKTFTMANLIQNLQRPFNYFT